MDYVRGGQFPLADYVRGDNICGGTESAPTPALYTCRGMQGRNIPHRKYGGPVGRAAVMTCTYAICGRAHMHIWDLRTCTYSICGRSHMHIWDLRTCTYAICGLAHMHIWDLRTCTYAICGLAHMHIGDLRTCTYGLAHTRFAEVQLFPRGCHVATTWRTRCNHVATTWKQLHFRKSRMCKSAIPDMHMCTSANCVCASPQIPDVHVHVHVRKSRMCKSANPRCACVHVRKSSMCKSANPRCACVHVRMQIAYVHVMTAVTYRATVGTYWAVSSQGQATHNTHAHVYKYIAYAHIKTSRTIDAQTKGAATLSNIMSDHTHG